MGHVRVVVDGMNAAHIARHVHRDLFVTMRKKDGTSKPFYTGVLYGILQMLDGVLREFHPYQLLFAWDGVDSLWRKKIYSQYKQQRADARKGLTPDEKYMLEVFKNDMVPDAMRALKGLGVPNLTVPTLEADDIIGSLARATVRNDDAPPLLIVSTDSDYLQCVYAGRVRVYNPRKHSLIYQDDVTGALMEGASATPVAPCPRTYLWRKALVGDASDNLKGVAGIGPVRAAALIPRAPKEYSFRDWLRIERATLASTPYGARLLADKATVSRNLALMDLMHETYATAYALAHDIERKGAERTMRKAICVAYKDAMQELKTQPPLLKKPLGMYPSPASEFFLRRKFALAENADLFKTFLLEFDSVYQQSKGERLRDTYERKGRNDGT
jgi:5'-3' exonuclease